MSYHSFSTGSVPQSGVSLVRVNGDEISENVNKKIKTLHSEINQNTLDINDIVLEYNEIVANRNFEYVQYLNVGMAKDIENARAAAMKKPEPGGWFETLLFGEKKATFDRDRFIAELKALRSKSEFLKRFWDNQMIVWFRVNYQSNFPSFAGHQTIFGDGYLYNKLDVTTSSVVEYHGGERYGSKFLEDYSLSLFFRLRAENERKIKEMRSLSRYTKLKGDVFLSIDEYNSLELLADEQI